MKLDKKNLSIQALALLGLGLTIKLAFIYYSANYDKYSLSSFCSINDFIDCDGVAKSFAAQFLGIPLAYWGIFFYLIVLFLTFVDKLKKIKYLNFLEVFKAPNAYISVLGTISFIISMTLAGISLFKIHKLCILCVVTYFIDLIITLIASDGMFKNIICSFKTTFIDFIDGVKKFFLAFIILSLIFTSFLTYSAITLKFVPHIKIHNEILKYHKIKYNPYRIKGNILGNENGTVVVELYSDFVCPLCYINNIILHQIVKDFKNIKIVHHNFPFDSECNKFLTTNIHPKACFMSKGAIAARKQGNYWEMASLLYENKPQSIEAMLGLAEQLGFDKAKFIEHLNSKEVIDEIQAEINKAEELKINATPTMFINDERVVGVKSYSQLKEILVKHGAKRK